MTEAWAIFGAVAATHALGVSSPGPDFDVIVRQTLVHGRGIGVATALGIGSGILFHVAWGMFGLGWAVDRFPGLLDVLRYGGAAVLLWDSA
jgi:threonine/homoserine/homoserine lactone efflux protein